MWLKKSVTVNMYWNQGDVAATENTTSSIKLSKNLNLISDSFFDSLNILELSNIFLNKAI